MEIALQKFTITTSHNCAQQLTAKYYDQEKRKICYVTTSFERVTVETDKALVDTPFWRHDFTDKKPSLTIEWDPKDSNDKGTILRTHFLNHNEVWCEGIENANLLQRLFILDDGMTIDKDVYERLNQTNNAMNIYSAMNYEEQKNVIYSFGGNPVTKTQRAMFLWLFEINTGRLMFRDRENGVNNLKRFLEMFEDKNTRAGAEIEIMARKAVALGIIKENDKVFYLDGETVASTYEQLFAFLRSNPVKYEQQVKRMVQMKDAYIEPIDIDSLPTPRMETSDKDKAPKDEKAWTMEEVAQLSRERDSARAGQDIEAENAIVEKMKVARKWFKSKGVDMNSEIIKFNKSLQAEPA